MTPPSTMTSPKEPIRTPRDTIGMPMSPEKMPEPRLLEREDAVPVSFHVNHGPAHGRRRVQRRVQPAEVRFTVVGIFAFRVSMVNQHPEVGTTAFHRGPLQHLQIAVRIAKGSDRVLPNLFIDGDRLTGAVIDEIDLRKAEQDRDVT